MTDNPDPSAPYLDGSYLRYYRAVNEAREEFLVYHLGGRGFCAELTSAARAMAYAWGHGLQLALDSTKFAYRYRAGWNDYFEPFCRDSSEVNRDRVKERFQFERRRHFVGLRAYDPKQFAFGLLSLDSLHPRLAHFTKLIFRLSYDSAREVASLWRGLALPRHYAALHIRRGDKVGDEDVFYPVDRYFEALDEIGGLGGKAVFVMSDDYEAVVEVKRFLNATGCRSRVVSLCRPEHAGFSVEKLRAGQDFAGDGSVFGSDEARRRYTWFETNRLLADISIAAGAEQFVTTARSNVGTAIWYLHGDPGKCRRLT
jgi:hypothetical protein